MTAAAAAARPETCTTCVADPKAAPSRYCAPGRCLCSHEACPAFATWQPPRSLDNVSAIRRRRKPSASKWAEREGSTWIDSL